MIVSRVFLSVDPRDPDSNQIKLLPILNPSSLPRERRALQFRVISDTASKTDDQVHKSAQFVIHVRINVIYNQALKSTNSRSTW